MFDMTNPFMWVNLIFTFTPFLVIWATALLTIVSIMKGWKADALVLPGVWVILQAIGSVIFYPLKGYLQQLSNQNELAWVIGLCISALLYLVICGVYLYTVLLVCLRSPNNTKDFGSRINRSLWSLAKFLIFKFKPKNYNE